MENIKQPKTINDINKNEKKENIKKKTNKYNYYIN